MKRESSLAVSKKNPSTHHDVILIMEWSLTDTIEEKNDQWMNQVCCKR